jgi:chemotaxis protein MotB
MKHLIVFAGCILLGACGVDKELYNSKVAELDKTKAELDEARANADRAKKAAAAKQKELDDENASLKARLEELGQNLNSKTTDLDAAKKRMEELRKAQEQAEARAKQFREMVAKFKSMVDAGKLEVVFRDGLMLVKLPDNILFDPGKTDLKPAGQDAIKQVATILADIEGRKFQVTGHTDNKQLSHHSAFKSNWELSTQRAVEVVKFMNKTEEKKLANRLSAAGYADTLPVAGNDTEAGRKQNRRIEIVVVPKIEELPGMEDVMKK